MSLTRDAILGIKDYQTAEVDVPEWGGKVTVRSLSLRDRAVLFDGQLDTNVARADSMAQVVAAAVINGDGHLMFKREDVEALAQKSAEAIERVANEILTLSGILKPEELEKNSEPAPTASSS